MHIYEINAIPDVTLLQSESFMPTSCISAVFRASLTQLCALSNKDASAVQLVFSTDMYGALQMYLAYYGSETTPVINLAEQLRTQNYSVDELSNERSAALMKDMSEALSTDIAVVTKSEKILTSTLSATGYYYYSDTFDIGKDGHPDNYSLLLNSLQQTPDTYILMQLIPTGLLQHESYAISDMSTALEQAVKGLYVYSQFIREPFAEPALNTFRYYAARIGQPLFLFSIVVASKSGSSVKMASQVVSTLQTQNARPIGLEIYQIAERDYLAQAPEQLPFQFSALLQQRYRNSGIWNMLTIKPVNLTRLPFFVTAEEAACFFRLPIGDGTIAGIQTNRIARSKEAISSAVIDDNNIAVGTLRGLTKQIGIPLKSLTQHMLIVGMPGTGKTTFSINLLLQLYRKGIPFLAIEPTKSEYRAMIDAIPELQIFTPGNNAVSPFLVNPFIPPCGIRVEQYIPSLASAFKAAFSMPQPLDMIFLSAIRKSYTEYGWKNRSMSGDSDVTPFGLYEFILVFKRIVDSMEYSREVRANIQSGGTLRLMNLIEQNRDIYDTICSVPLEDLLNKPTVLELNAIDNPEYKSLIMALLLINIGLYTKHVQRGDGTLKNVLLIDEAHVLLSPASQTASEDRADAGGATVKAIQNMIAEIRAYGTGIVIADQSPSKVSNEIIANTDIKVAFRLVSAKERDLLADSAAMNITEKQYLSRLGVGEAFIFYRLLDTPQLVITPDIRESENIRLHVSNAEIAERMDYWNTHQSLLIPFYECRFSSVCKQGCSYATREQAEYYASKVFDTFSDKIKDTETLAKYLYRLHKLIEHYERMADRSEENIQLNNCTKIRFLRKILLETQLRLSQQDREKLLNLSLQ